MDNIKLITVSDQVEQAFTANVPEGWKNEVYLSRIHNTPRCIVAATSPDGTVTLSIGDPYMPGFMPPNPMIDHTNPMMNMNPMMQVAHYTPADQFFQYYLQQKFGQVPGFKMHRMERAQDFGQVYYEMNTKSGRQVTVTDVRIFFEFMYENKTCQALINGATINMGIAWSAEVCGILGAEKPEQYSPLLLEMVKSCKINPAWNQQQQMMHQQTMSNMQTNHQNQLMNWNVMNQNHNMNMQTMQNSFNAHNQMWASNQQTIDSNFQSWQNQQASIDHMHGQSVNAIKGEHTVMNQSGNTFQVDNSYEKYFMNKHNNTYIGTHSTTNLQDLNQSHGVNPDDYEEVKIVK